MTNKPMLSVELRSFLEGVVKLCAVHGPTYNELRALLDKPEYPRVEIVKAHTHTCACVVGDSGVCDCGAVVNGVCVKVEPAAQHQGEPTPITDDMDRLMEAYRRGEFSAEGGSDTVEALSVASFDAAESHGHDADSYMAGYCAALYEQAKPFIWLALKPKQQGEPVYMVRSHGSDCWEEMSGESLEMCHAQPVEYEVRKLYAEQPAPVAVDAPELSGEELEFLKSVHAYSGSKLHSCFGEDGSRLWPRLEEIGLIKCLGSFKWELTFDALGMGIKARLNGVKP